MNIDSYIPYSKGSNTSNQGSCGIDRFFSHLNLTQATQASAHSARNSCTLPVTLAAAEQRSSRICPRDCAQPGHELSLTAVPVPSLA